MTTYIIYRLAPDRRCWAYMELREAAVDDAMSLAMASPEGALVEVWERTDEHDYPIFGAERLRRGLRLRWREGYGPSPEEECAPR